MMTLTSTPLAQSAIDEAIATALQRIRSRAEGLGDSFRVLADATGRAASGGKRFRPALVAASYEAFGGDPALVPAISPVAAAFELLHTAFVIHDDVIDHDLERRGALNVAGEFRVRAAERGADAAGAALLGDAAAILAGDLLLYEASRLVALADVPTAAKERLFGLLDDSVLVSAAGELADVEHAVLPDTPDTADLLATAHDKTAVYSFTAPLCAGALLAGASDDEVAALRGAGGGLGLAFQLVDDLIGAFGSAQQAGRVEGGDLREAKRTPLVALARESADWPLVTAALADAWTGPVAVRAAQRALEESGARGRLLELIDDVLEDAVAHADGLPRRAHDLVRTLAQGVQERIP